MVSKSARADLPAQLAEALAPVASTLEIDLDDVEVAVMGKRLRIALIIDADRPVDLDLVAQVSKEFAEALDDPAGAGGLMGEDPYVLEVSSRGVDRPLEHPKHWRRNAGRLVRCERRSGPPITGRIKSSDELGAFLEVEGATESEFVSYDGLIKATIVVEFTRKEPADSSSVDADAAEAAGGHDAVAEDDPR